MSNSLVLGEAVHTPQPDTFKYVWRGIETPGHPSSLVLVEYWRACEARGGLRMGRDIPSRALAPILRSLAISEPVADWSDSILRLAGLGYAQGYGRDVTGMRLSELHRDDPKGHAFLLEGARRAERENQPTFGEIRAMVGGQDAIRFEIVGLPIYAPDGVTKWNLSGAFRF